MHCIDKNSVSSKRRWIDENNALIEIEIGLSEIEIDVCGEFLVK